MRFTKAEAVLWRSSVDRAAQRAKRGDEFNFFRYWGDALWDYTTRFAGGKYLKATPAPIDIELATMLYGRVKTKKVIY